MLREHSGADAVIINILLGALWHYITYIVCITAGNSFFDSFKKMYQPRKWEKGGRFYSDLLKINKWKDILPQHIEKNGFSKEHIDNTSIPYLDEFIMETCRAEWNHGVNCMYAAVLLIINNLMTAVIFVLLLLLINLPFVLIQRYNRFRLQRLRNLIIKRNRLRLQRST